MSADQDLHYFKNKRFNYSNGRLIRMFKVYRIMFVHV